MRYPLLHWNNQSPLSGLPRFSPYPLIFLILFYFCSYSVAIHAQSHEAIFEHFDQGNGLSGPVNCIAMDSIGFLWLGTNDGLNRFDGRQFTVFRNDPEDDHSIPSNIVNDLYVDASGKVWAATNKGLCYNENGTDSFHTIHFQDSLESIDRYRTYAVTGTREGLIWFSSRKHLHLLTEGIIKRSFSLSTSEKFITRSLLVAENTHVWAGTNEGIYVLDSETGTILHNPVHSDFSKQRQLQVAAGPAVAYVQDTMLMGSWYAGLQKVFLSGNSVINIPCNDEVSEDPRRYIVNGIAPTGEPGEWWIGTYGDGLSVFHSSSNSFDRHVKHDPARPASLSSNTIQCLFADPSGILWIGTQEGLDKYDPLVQQFTSLSLPGTESEFSVYRLPSSIQESTIQPDILYVGVSGIGLLKYDVKFHSFEVLSHDPGNPESLPDNNIYALHTDSRGNTWVGMRTGICLFDQYRNQFKPASFPGAEDLTGVHLILEDSERALWFGTHSNGLYYYNPHNSELIHYQYEKHNTGGLPDNRVFSMALDQEGKLWVGTQNQGLWCLDREKGKTMHFEFQKEDPNSLPDNGVFDLFADAHNTLWIATENGLAQMNLTNLEISRFTTREGLSNNTVYSITPAESGHLWLGTANGLSMFAPHEGTFRNFYITDGLPSNRIDGEFHFAKDGRLYFGTRGKLNFFRPEMMRRNTRVPPVIITGYSILGKHMPSLRTHGGQDIIHLSYEKNMVTFHFTALNFTNPELNQYAYMLEGFDHDWISAGNRQSATYTNLNGGKYTFRVQGANNDHLWNRKGASALVIVHPPFWQTWWFYLACILMILTILYSFYRIRVSQILRLHTIRHRISRDLHDDVGSTLSSIHMISKMALDNPEQKNSPVVLETISSASHQAMGLMQDIVWSINPENDHMEMVLIRMRQYASEVLEAVNIEVQFKVDEHCRQISLPLETRKDIYLIFKEAINNLAKYSGAQMATIHLYNSKDWLHLKIKDDGRGFKVEEVDMGNGLRNMQFRASQLRGKIHIETHPGKGTLIHLMLPFVP